VSGGFDLADQLQDAVQRAYAAEQPLCIAGSGSKRFLGASIAGELLNIAEHAGVIEYRPEELVVTARAGTPLKDLADMLAQHRQMLPFEPPEYGGGGTLGGALAAGLSGPGRPWYGALRDAVLGIEMLNGYGQRLRFGGQVMKNVAGYDVSRLMCGSFGTLGVILSVSVRTRPQPEQQHTLKFEMERQAGLERVVELGRSALPISATCQVDGNLSLRLSGSSADLDDAIGRLGGEPGDPRLWNAVRDQTAAYFDGGKAAGSLWRVSVPFAAPYPPLEGTWLTEWAGALRWLWTSAEATRVVQAVRAVDGYAVRFDSVADAFMSLDSHLLRYHQRIKAAFDPKGILNPGRVC
jgi:glycolate oxidase FAD binding subunit